MHTQLFKQFIAQHRYHLLALGSIIAVFIAFGVYHLGKFETTDEHLWKYDRIGQYWEALGSGDWAKTYINDKPGVTVALVSGLGLLAEPYPERNEFGPKTDRLFESYNIQQTEITNVRFRLPVLLFSALSLILFFWLIYRIWKSLDLALLATLFIGLTPILLGISQIINPDSFFWIFGSLAAISYFVVLQTSLWRYVLLTGVLTGFALLSKYTGFILFVFFGFALLFSIGYSTLTPIKPTHRVRALGRHILYLIVIGLLALLVFSHFLPAVWVNPGYLFKGISQFFESGSSIRWLILGAALVLGSVVGWHFRQRILMLAAGSLPTRFIGFFSGLVATLFLSLLVLSLINVWTGQSLAPLDALRDTAYSNEPRNYDFRPLLTKETAFLHKQMPLLLLAAYPLIFSLPPIILFLVSFGAIQIIRKKLTPLGMTVVSTVLAFALAYLFSTIFVGVVTNARYLIIVYPLFSLVAAVVLFESVITYQWLKPRFFVSLFGLLFLLHIGLLWNIRPFYFSYTNSLLPRQFSIHDSWGHGSYEAAQYLNSLPRSENLIIWSNSDTVCRFFRGQCLRSRRIDLGQVTPDYFVISKRGVTKERNRFILENNPNPQKDSAYYFDRLEEKSVWRLEILQRPTNFISIIPFERP